MKPWVLVAGLLLCFLRVSSALEGSLVSAQTAPSKVSTVCVVSPDAPAGPLEIRVEPRSRSHVVSLLPVSRNMVRVDTLSQLDGDWMQIKSDSIQGWVEGKQLVCRAPADQAREIITIQASRTVELLKQRNLRELSRLVHPIKGVHFSPDAFLNQQANVSFTTVTLPRAFRETRRRVWGTYDGSGDPIRLTFTEYYQRFIYDRDFVMASEISYNGGSIGKSNTHDNSVEEYPNAIIVEYYMPGVRPESEGMDWASLRLIFEQHRSVWYLVYVVHDKWSI